MALSLAWFLLCAWEVWSEPDTLKHYLVVGHLHVLDATIRKLDGPDAVATKSAFLQSQVNSLKHSEWRQKAANTIRPPFPQMNPDKVTLRFAASKLGDMPVVKISSVSSEPNNVVKLIDQVMYEYVSAKKKERDRTPEGRAYSAAVEAFLRSQLEVAQLKVQTKELADMDSPSVPVLDSLRLQLREAESKHMAAKDALGKLPLEDEGRFEIFPAEKSGPVEHTLTPWLLVALHPWGALFTSIVAWVLAVVLVPNRFAATSKVISSEAVPA